MSAEIWTDEKIREAFIYDGGESAYHDPINGEKEQRRIAGAIFDEWLKRHDEAVRTEALTTPCTCREDVVCGACMSGATDHATATRQKLDDITRKLDEVVPTPPADDVREALESLLEKFISGTWSLDVANRILARFEVRPRGTVADAEVEAAKEALGHAGSGVTTPRMRAALEAAREAQR